jgi:hypothetical protein
MVVVDTTEEGWRLLRMMSHDLGKDGPRCLRTVAEYAAELYGPFRDDAARLNAESRTLAFLVRWKRIIRWGA